MQPSASGPHRVRRRDVLDRHWKGRLLGFKQKNDGMVAIVQHVYTIADLHICRPPNLHSPFASNYVFPSTLVEEQPIQSLSGTFMAVHAHIGEVMFANVPMKDLVERRIFFYSYNYIVPKTTEAYGKLEPIDPPSLQSPAWPIPDDWSLLSLKQKVVDDLKASPDEDVVLPHMQVGGVVKDAPDVSTQPRSALAESKQLLLEYPTGVEGALAASSSSAHEELIDVQEHEAVADAILEVEISRFASIVIDDEEFVFLHDIEKACSLRMDECLSLLKTSSAMAPSLALLKARKRKRSQHDKLDTSFDISEAPSQHLIETEWWHDLVQRLSPTLKDSGKRSFRMVLITFLDSSRGRMLPFWDMQNDSAKECFLHNEDHEIESVIEIELEIEIENEIDIETLYASKTTSGVVGTLYLGMWPI
ncbi:hypothetical protein L7F22_064288 [Adiantum nelumboides]|nr:hypothetical protein [Adiantum nelumboides]